MKTPNSRIAFAFLCGLSLCFGCHNAAGPQGLVPVEGVVNCNGNPVEDASVLLRPLTEAGLAASATTDAAGRFSLMSFEPGDGAKPGDYLVTVTKFDIRGEVHIIRPDGTNQKIVQDERTIANRLPEEYASPSTTPLKMTVTKNADVPFALNLSGEADETPKPFKEANRRL